MSTTVADKDPVTLDDERVGLQVAPRAIGTGNAVEAPITAPRGPSANRMPGMPSRSTAPATMGSRL